MRPSKRSKSFSRINSRKSSPLVALVFLLVTPFVACAAAREGTFAGLFAASRVSLRAAVRPVGDGRLAVSFDLSSLDGEFHTALAKLSHATSTVSVKAYRRSDGFLPFWKLVGQYREDRKADFDPFADKFLIEAGGGKAGWVSRASLLEELAAETVSSPLLLAPGHYSIKFRLEIRPFIPEPPLTFFAFFFPLGKFSSGWLRSSIAVPGGAP
jgi:hypothetical protein